MSDLFSRLSKLVGPGAARNMLTSAPAEEDDQIQDFAPGNTDFLTPEQHQDAQDFKAAKLKDEQSKDLADYIAAMQADQATNNTNSFLSPEQKAAMDNYTNAALMTNRADLSSPNDQFATPQELAQIPVGPDPRTAYPSVRSERGPLINADGQEVPPFLQPITNPGAPGMSPRPDSSLSGQINPGGPGGPFGVLHEVTQPGQPMPNFPVAPAPAAPVPPRVPTSLGVSPKPIPTELNEPNQPSLGSVENLMAAQNAANNVRSVNNTSQGLDLVSAGIAGLGSNSIVKPSGQALFKQLGEGADKITTDYKDLVAMEKNDAKSPVSKAMQRYAKKLGFDAKGLSAGDMEKLMPFVFKGFEAEENRKARSQDLALRLREMNQRFALNREQKEADKIEKRDLKQKKQDIDRFDKMGKLISAEVASSRSSFGKNANNVRAALAIERLAEGRNLDKLTTREVQEVARSLDALLSQGQATISGTEHLIPKAYRADVAKIAEYITAKNKGAGMGSFLKQMMETVKRERNLAEEQIKKTQKKLLAPYADLREKDPHAWSIMMKQHDLPDDPFDEDVPDAKDLNKEFEGF